MSRSSQKGKREFCVFINVIGDHAVPGGTFPTRREAFESARKQYEKLKDVPTFLSVYVEPLDGDTLGGVIFALPVPDFEERLAAAYPAIRGEKSAALRPEKGTEKD